MSETLEAGKLILGSLVFVGGMRYIYMIIATAREEKTGE